MRTSVLKKDQVLATTVWFDAEMLHVRLQDERVVSVPISWFPRLTAASPEQREKWRFVGWGIGIHWPDIDEDISVAALMR